MPITVLNEIEPQKCVFIVIVFLINNINQSKQKLANKIKNDERWKVYPSSLKQNKDME